MKYWICILIYIQKKTDTTEVMYNYISRILRKMDHWKEENEDAIYARINAFFLNQKHNNKLRISVDTIKAIKVNFAKINESFIKN